QGERPGSGILDPERDPHRVAHLLRPTRASLDGHWQVGGRNTGPDDPLDQVQVAEAARAAVAADDLLDRTAEVDVDEIGLVVLRDEAGGLGHCLDVGTVDLDPDWPLDLVELAALEDPAYPAADPLRVEELGEHHVGTHPTADPAEGRLGNPRHRGEVERERGPGRVREHHTRKIASRSVPQVLSRDRGVWRLVLPEDRDHPPAAAIIPELDAVDAPHEGLRVVGGPARLVGREDLDHVAELVGPTADLPLEEAVLLETRAGAADVLVDAPGQPDTGAIGPLARRHQ